MPLFAFFALGVLARRAVARAFEMHIPLSPCSTPTQHEFPPITREIGNGVGRGTLVFEMHIPLSPCSTPTQHQFPPITREIGNGIRRWTLEVGRWAFFFF